MSRILKLSGLIPEPMRVVHSLISYCHSSGPYWSLTRLWLPIWKHRSGSCGLRLTTQMRHFNKSLTTHENVSRVIGPVVPLRGSPYILTPGSTINTGGSKAGLYMLSGQGGDLFLGSFSSIVSYFPLNIKIQFLVTEEPSPTD